MTQAERIIGMFGGLSKLAKALGHKHPSTVQGWQERGFIPAARQRDVLAAAVVENVPLTPAHFFDPADEPPSSAEAKAS